MLQRIHNILARITINTKTEASIWALKLQTRLTNRWPHLNASTGTAEELLEELLEGLHRDKDGRFLAYKKVID